MPSKRQNKLNNQRLEALKYAVLVHETSRYHHTKTLQSQALEQYLLQRFEGYEESKQRLVQANSEQMAQKPLKNEPEFKLPEALQPLDAIRIKINEETTGLAAALIDLVKELISNPADQKTVIGVIEESCIPTAIETEMLIHTENLVNKQQPNLSHFHEDYHKMVSEQAVKVEEARTNANSNPASLLKKLIHASVITSQLRAATRCVRRNQASPTFITNSHAFFQSPKVHTATETYANKISQLVQPRHNVASTHFDLHSYLKLCLLNNTGTKKDDEEENVFQAAWRSR